MSSQIVKKIQLDYEFHFNDTLILKKAETKSLVNTQVNFDSDEFNLYEIEKETDITFCLKEFKVQNFKHVK